MSAPCNLKCLLMSRIAMSTPKIARGSTASTILTLRTTRRGAECALAATRVRTRIAAKDPSAPWTTSSTLNPAPTLLLSAANNLRPVSVLDWATPPPAPETATRTATAVARRSAARLAVDSYALTQQLIVTSSHLILCLLRLDLMRQCWRNVRRRS